MADKQLIKTNPLYPRLLLSEWFYAAYSIFEKRISDKNKEISNNKRIINTYPVCEQKELIGKNFTSLFYFLFGLMIFIALGGNTLAIFGVWLDKFKVISDAVEVWQKLLIHFMYCAPITWIPIILAVFFFFKAKEAKSNIESIRRRNYAKQKRYEKEIDSHNELARKLESKNTVIRQEIDELTKHRDLLSKAFNHSMNFIYPKYRNIICVSQFTQYIESGRCESFEGPHGCYNLFEQELRMDLIIDKLDIVISKLDKVIENQHEMVSLLKSIDQTTKEIKADTDLIAMNTAITALASLEMAGSINDVASSLDKVNSNITSFDNYYRRYH